jgi:hypothetical protein
MPCWAESSPSKCLEKSSMPFLPAAGFRAACINLQTQQVSTAPPRRLPHPPSRNIMQHSPWAYWPFPLYWTKLRNINSECQSSTHSGSGVDQWTNVEEQGCGIELVNFLLLIYTCRPGTEITLQPSWQASHNTNIKSRETKQAIKTTN